MNPQSAVDFSVLFYVPNLIGYARLLICFAGHTLKSESPLIAVLLYAIFAALDGVDGWAARKLGQCSAFGAWLDVIVDNLGRTMLWSNFQWGFLISSLEWITFICNHNKGSRWKEQLKVKSPMFVQQVMANGFKNLHGILAIGGLHILPIWLFAWEHDIFKTQTSSSLLAILTPIIGSVVLCLGRTLCAMVEIWCIYIHIKFLIKNDTTDT